MSTVALISWATLKYRSSEKRNDAERSTVKKRHETGETADSKELDIHLFFDCIQKLPGWKAKYWLLYIHRNDPPQFATSQILGRVYVGFSGCFL